MSSSLLDQIEHDALDPNVAVATALRKCVALGGRSGSEALRDWATRELDGYRHDDEVPDYRIIPALIYGDGVTRGYQFWRQTFAPSHFPEPLREVIGERVTFRDGVGRIEELAKQPDISIALPGGSELTRLFNQTIGDPHQQIHSLYWGVNQAMLRGTLDHIRTVLTRLVAELRAVTPVDAQVPTREAANQAVHYISTGNRSPVTIVTASGEYATATVAPPTAPQSAFWTKGRRIGAAIVGVATVAGTIIAAIQFFL